MNKSIITVENLHKTYNQKNGREIKAVDGVSFDVKKGEIFGLLGPNGAGKTTTIGMLTTRVNITRGTASIADIDTLQKVAIKRKIAIVPQTLTLDRSLTARENLIFHAKYFGVPKDEGENKADELLNWLGLSNRANDFISSYSGGMAQRLMIARALMHDPEVLFLDEATLGLDPQSRRLLWDKISELNNNGQTIFLTTHYMDEAESLCDRVAIMDQGRILEIDKPSELKKLIPNYNVIETEVSEAKEPFVREINDLETKDVKREGNRFFLYSKGGKSLINEVVGIATKHDVEIKSIQFNTPTLEDVFIHLTGRGLED